MTMKVREALLGIQQGTAPDPHGWMVRGRLSGLSAAGPTDRSRRRSSGDLPGSPDPSG